MAAQEQRAKLDADSPNETDDADLVRRYTLSPNQSAKDPHANVTIHNLRELWRGALDPFLVEAFTRRTERAN